MQSGLVWSRAMNRPGRNFSGATVLNTELVPKRLEMLHELVPAASSFAVLLNPSNRNAEGQWRDSKKRRAVAGCNCTVCTPAMTMRLMGYADIWGL